jgi:hypothetical protein
MVQDGDMSILSDFERRLEGVIEGIFTKAFRSGLQPVELARRILKEMEANKSVGVREVWVPNRFVFHLSAPDRERFEQTEKALRRELEHVIVDGAQERGWGLVGPPEVQFDTDASLGQGEFSIESSLVEGPTTGVPVAGGGERRSEAREGALHLLERGRPVKTFPLAKERVIIGRLGDSDVVLSDPGVSRRHAEIRQEDGEWIIADLGSTNGTMVNEATIGERALQEGDRITIGRHVLEFRSR